MKSKTSVLCKSISIAIGVLCFILCIIEDSFTTQLEIVSFGILSVVLYTSLAMIIDKIAKTTQEQKRIYDSINALSEKIDILLGTDKISVAIENLKADNSISYENEEDVAIKSEEDLTWNCPDCNNIELYANTICTKCGYDRNEH